ncbi:MAG TPA: hypothetical protein VK176_11650 [Phycisphaerales bacterium]|nr:hypothetical protein [Phycisphaerales bacterium]
MQSQPCIPPGRRESVIHQRRRVVAEERARGGQAFTPDQPVDVLQPDGQTWIPGRCIEQTPAFVRVEVDVAGRTETRKVVPERLRPRRQS